RWDVRLKVLDLPPNGRRAELVKITRAAAVFLATRWSSFDPGDRGGLDVPVLEPVIGLSDEEVGRLASHIDSPCDYLLVRSAEPMLGRLFSPPLPLSRRPRPVFP